MTSVKEKNKIVDTEQDHCYVKPNSYSVYEMLLSSGDETLLEKSSVTCVSLTVTHWAQQDHAYSTQAGNPQTPIDHVPLGLQS